MRKDYKTLGIEENADEKTIKKAYFKLIRKHSPEKDPEQFQIIRAAYERLLEEKNQPEQGIPLEFPADDKFAMSMFDQIQQLMQEQEYERASQTAAEGMKYYNDVECFLYMYARCSILDGKSGKAVKAFEKLVKRYPEKLHYKGDLAKAYYMRGYGRKAYAMFREAYEEDWRETDFLEQYGMCCLDQEKYDESARILQEMIDSIPDERVSRNIPEILEAYTGVFMSYISCRFSVKTTVEKCCAFLDRIGNGVDDYEEQMVSLLLVVHTADTVCEGEKIHPLAEKIEALLPELFDEEEFEDEKEARELMEDERFSRLMKLTVEAFMVSDDVAAYSDPSDRYIEFMQMDAFLCQLEAWPKQRGELKLLEEAYPALYECGSEIWDMLKRSKGNKAYMKDIMMADYIKLEKKYQCGHYFELYPEKRQKSVQVQWDSGEEGTFVRQNKKIGRNDPCPCGSGKKYKNCCGRA